MWDFMEMVNTLFIPFSIPSSLLQQYKAGFQSRGQKQGMVYGFYLYSTGKWKNEI